MANPVCTATTWFENGKEYTIPFINPKQQKALELHAMALELAAIGGTDYTADLTVLVDDSEVLAGFANPDQITAANIAICYANATEAGATVPAAIGDKLDATKSIVLYDDERLRKACTLLRCKLGRAEAYPQT
jgi:hypothetical protein